MSNFVRGEGPQDAKLMIVGQAPGPEEDNCGRPFVGPSGQMVTEFCEETGIDRSQCWVTNVSKYRPPDDDIFRLKEIGIDIRDQIRNLWREITEVRPNCILALGNTALSATAGVSGITNYRGSILPSINGLPKVVGTYHPAALLHQKGSELPDYRQSIIIEMDFKRAHAQSKFKEYRPPQRSLMVVRTSNALYNFEQRRKSNRLSVDIETTKCVPLCIGLAFSKYDAISIPILDLQTPENPNGITRRELATIWQMLARMFQQYDIIGQNFKFDETKLNHYGFQIKKLLSDTMLKGHTVNPEFPQSLEFLTSIYTEEPFYKNERKDYDARKDDIKKLLIYNARDAAVTWEVDDELEKDLIEDGTHDFFYNTVMSFHKPYINLEREGMLVDEDYRNILDHYYTEQASILELHLGNLTGCPDANFNSPDQVADILYNKMKFPRRKDTSADTLVALMANVAKQPYRVRVLEDQLKYRKVKKTKSTYINAKLDYDGRMRTQVRITGTETGRTSNSILEAPIRPKKMGVAFQTMTKHGQIGTELRRMFIPDPGYVFLEVDAAQAEDRPVALLANDEEAFEFWRQGRDRHRYTASIVFEFKESSIDWKSKAGKEYRFIGKKVRHAGNYDMRKHRCMQVINTEAQKFNMDIKVSEWKAGQFLDRFHAASPKIRGVFHKAIQEALYENNRVLVTPYGRRRQFFGRWGDDLFKEAYAFIPQSTVSDHVKLALVRVLGRLQGLRVVLEAHDSFTSLVKPNDLGIVTKVIKEEMERPIDFSKCTIPRGVIVIPSEFQVGERNWKDLVDYKVEDLAA